MLLALGSRQGPRRGLEEVGVDLEEGASSWSTGLADHRRGVYAAGDSRILMSRVGMQGGSQMRHISATVMPRTFKQVSSKYSGAEIDTVGCVQKAVDGGRDRGETLSLELAGTAGEDEGRADGFGRVLPTHTGSNRRVVAVLGQRDGAPISVAVSESLTSTAGAGVTVYHR